MAALNSIYGLFPGPHAAERGMNALRDAGVAPDKILVMSSEPFEEYSFAQGESRTLMPWIAVMGGLIGGTCGFSLAWFTQVAYQPTLDHRWNAQRGAMADRDRDLRTDDDGRDCGHGHYAAGFDQTPELEACAV